MRPSGELPSLASLRAAVDLNITAAMWLNERFLRLLRDRVGISGGSHTHSYSSEQDSVIVNVSSLAALVPFRSWAVYCAGKAARDMALRVIAEDTAGERLRVLNYAPGPLDTDMQRLVRTSRGVDPALQRQFRNAEQRAELVRPIDSAETLLSLIEGATYTSGAHVDYYDL